MFRDHKMITELIETSRKAIRVQVDSNQAASRLENCPKPESKRLAPCPQAACRLVTGWAYCFLLLLLPSLFFCTCSSSLSKP